MLSFDRRCLSFCWQAIQRSKALKEILVCLCWKFKRLTWRLKSWQKRGKTRRNKQLQARANSHPVRICVFAHAQMSTRTYEEFEDVSHAWWCQHNCSLVVCFHHWLGILFHSHLLMYTVKYCLKKEKKNPQKPRLWSLRAHTHQPSCSIWCWSTMAPPSQTTAAGSRLPPLHTSIRHQGCSILENNTENKTCHFTDFVACVILFVYNRHCC